MENLNEMKENDKSYEKINTIYNSDFKWPKKIKKVSSNNFNVQNTKTYLQINVV